MMRNCVLQMLLVAGVLLLLIHLPSSASQQNVSQIPEPGLEPEADTPKEIIYSCGSLRKNGISCPTITMSDDPTVTVNNTYGWSIKNVPRSVVVVADPLKSQLQNFTVTATKKRLSTKYDVQGCLYVRNTDLNTPILLQGLTVTGSPKPALNELLPQLNLSAPLSVITGLADNIISSIDASLDSILSGDAKTMLDPNNGILAQMGLPLDDLKDQQVDVECDPAFRHSQSGGYLIPPGLLMHCNYTLSLGSGLRALVAAAGMFQIPTTDQEAIKTKVASPSIMVNFTGAPETPIAGTAALRLNIECTRDINKCQESLTDQQGNPVKQPYIKPGLIDSQIVPYAVKVGNYCSKCDSTCPSGRDLQYTVTAELLPLDIPSPPPAISVTTARVGPCVTGPQPPITPPIIITPTQPGTPSPHPGLSLAPISNLLDKMQAVSQQRRAQFRAELQLLREAKAAAAATAAVQTATVGGQPAGGVGSTVQVGRGPRSRVQQRQQQQQVAGVSGPPNLSATAT